MKKLIVFFATALIAFTANAQFGLKAGANFSDLTGDGTSDAKTLVGFHGGVTYNMRINEMFSFSPDLLYSGQGAKVNGTDEKIKLNYLNLCAMFQYNNSSGFFAGTGPQLGFLMSAKEKNSGSSADIKDFFKSTDFDWAFALGYRMKSGFGIYGRYNLGLANIDDTGGGGSLKNSVIMVGFMYELSNDKK
jgi:hypothetical protein